MDPGAHQFPAMLVDAPALPQALIALHLPVVAVLIATGNVHPCKDAQKLSGKTFQTCLVLLIAIMNAAYICPLLNPRCDIQPEKEARL